MPLRRLGGARGAQKAQTQPGWVGSAGRLGQHHQEGPRGRWEPRDVQHCPEIVVASLKKGCGHQLKDCGHQLKDDRGHQLKDRGHQLKDCGHQLKDCGHRVEPSPGRGDKLSHSLRRLFLWLKPRRRFENLREALEWLLDLFGSASVWKWNFCGVNDPGKGGIEQKSSDSSQSKTLLVHREKIHPETSWFLLLAMTDPKSCFWDVLRVVRAVPGDPCPPGLTCPVWKSLWDFGCSPCLVLHPRLLWNTLEKVKRCFFGYF